MLIGLAIFLLLAAAALFAEIHLLDRLRHSSVNDWLADHVYLPALRMPALIGFVLGSYPSLYGLHDAPSLRDLLDFDWLGRAANLLFILPLLFSLLPAAGRLTALILPLQGMALTALLFAPLADLQQLAHPSYLPDARTGFALLILGLGGHLLGNSLARTIPYRESTLPLYDAVVLLAQAPVIFAYGRMLGSQV